MQLGLGWLVDKIQVKVRILEFSAGSNFTLLTSFKIAKTLLQQYQGGFMVYGFKGYYVKCKL